MSDNENEKTRTAGGDGGGGDDDVSPGAAFQQFVEMENLSNKLKLLNYESEYLLKWRMKPLSRHYFAIQTNPGEQFYSFTMLSAWLLQQAGILFDKPEEHDDPNAIISSILSQLRKFGYDVNFGLNKIKSGAGEHVIYTLNKFAEEALKYKKFSWKQPDYPEEAADEEAANDDDAELDLNKIEEDMLKQNLDDFEDEEQVLNMEGLNKLNIMTKNLQETKPEEILESNTDATEWKLEVERVLPQLKVMIKSDHKDWRTHIEQMHSLQDSIDDSLKETKTYLEKLYEEISKTLEKIGSREKYINNQLDASMQEFRSYQDRLAEIRETYRGRSTGINERAQTLSQITNELQRIKDEMNETGQNITDGTPLDRIKKAMIDIKGDMKNMDIRIGVLEHVLLQSKLRQKDLIHEQREK